MSSGQIRKEVNLITGLDLRIRPDMAKTPNTKDKYMHTDQRLSTERYKLYS